MRDWHPIGKHRYATDGEIFYWELLGELTPEEAREYMERLREVQDRYGFALLFADARASVTVPTATRREFIERYRAQAPPEHAIVVGGSAVLRAIAALVQSSMRLVLDMNVSVEFVDTTETGLARLSAARRRIRLARGLPLDG